MIYSTGVAKYYAADQKTGLNLDKVSNDELVKLIGSQLGEVEGVEDYAGKLEGVVVAKVISCEKHPDADKLKVCMIDDGGVTKKVDRNPEGLVQVVCGAPNAKAGILVAWIPPGNIVPSTVGTDDEFKLEARKLRGVVSNGMLASGKELGINDEHGGILEIDPSSEADKLLEPGTPFVKLYGLDDYLIDIENKMFTHRPDLFGNFGISREVAGILGQKYTSPDWYMNPVELDFAKSDMRISLNNTVKDVVPRLTVGLVDRVNVEPAAIWMQALINRWGSKSINNIVDYTNYYSIFTAQPTHAFDYDKLIAASGDKGAVLGTRMAKKGEKLRILGGKEITLDPSDIVIATDKKAVALAGVMGGAETEVDENTKRIVIECATFDMYTIRRTSMRHGLFTDAVTRYSKGQSPHQNEVVLKKMMSDMADYSGFKPAAYLEDSAKLKPNKTFEVSSEFINARLGSDLTTDQMSTMLHNVEFKVMQSKDVMTVTAPFWRTDIAIPEDIVEEIGRLYGYDNLQPSLPRRTSKPTAVDSLLATKRQIRKSLAAAGANEALTYSFINGKLLENVGQDAKNSFAIINALSPELEYYRQSVTPSLLDKVNMNIRKKYDEFALFEIARTHSKLHATDGPGGLPLELETTGLVYANKDDKSTPAFYCAKAYLELLGQGFGIKFSYKPFEQDPGYPMTSSFDINRSAMVFIGNEFCGIIGEYRPEVEQALKLPRNSAGFELSTESLMNAKPTTIYTPTSDFPISTQDLTLQVKKDLTFAELERLVVKTLEESKLWYDLSVISIYSDNDKTKNVSFRIKVAAFDKTLETSQVNGLVESIVSICEGVSASQIQCCSRVGFSLYRLLVDNFTLQRPTSDVQYALMKDITLNLTDRTTLTDDSVKGVIYGPELDENVNVAIDYNVLLKVYREAGSNHVVNAVVDGNTHEVLFKDIQLDPVKNTIGHFDLYAIKRGQKIKAEIPVTLIGDSPAVQKGANLNQIIDKLEVECIPSKLPDHFEIDISVITEIGDSIQVSDIKVDADVEILADTDATVARADEIKVREEEVAEEEPAEGEDGEESAGGEGSAEGESSGENKDENNGEKSDDKKEDQQILETTERAGQALRKKKHKQKQRG